MTTWRGVRLHLEQESVWSALTNEYRSQSVRQVCSTCGCYAGRECFVLDVQQAVDWARII